MYIKIFKDEKDEEHHLIGADQPDTVSPTHTCMSHMLKCDVHMQGLGCSVVFNSFTISVPDREVCYSLSYVSHHQKFFIFSSEKSSSFQN